MAWWIEMLPCVLGVPGSIPGTAAIFRRTQAWLTEIFTFEMICMTEASPGFDPAPA